MVSVTDTGSEVHFTVGSLRHTSRRAGGADFQGELGLLKAALLYADSVELVSVGASFVAGLDGLGKLPTPEKLALMRRFMPDMDLGGSPKEADDVLQRMDAVIEKLRRRRRLSSREVTILIYLKERWRQIEEHVDATFRKWGAEDYRTALGSGMLELSPFSNVSPDDMLKIGMAEKVSYTRPLADKAYDEYRDTILEAVGNKETIPLFDDLTGDIVGRAVRRGLIRPSPGAKRRSKHGGLSGDLLQRLPTFERASVAEVLDVRKELSEYLNAFRKAVAESATTIESASWAVADFAEEAELVFRDNVAPTVREIEQRVQSNRDLKEMTYRYGPYTALGVSSSIGAFLGTGSVLAGLAVLAGNVAAGGLQGAAASKKERSELESERLYFYYRAGKMLGRRW